MFARSDLVGFTRIRCDSPGYGAPAPAVATSASEWICPSLLSSPAPPCPVAASAREQSPRAAATLPALIQLDLVGFTWIWCDSLGFTPSRLDAPGPPRAPSTSRPSVSISCVSCLSWFISKFLRSFPCLPCVPWAPTLRSDSPGRRRPLALRPPSQASRHPPARSARAGSPHRIRVDPCSSVVSFFESAS